MPRREVETITHSALPPYRLHCNLCDIEWEDPKFKNPEAPDRMSTSWYQAVQRHRLTRQHQIALSGNE